MSDVTDAINENAPSVFELDVLLSLAVQGAGAAPSPKLQGLFARADKWVSALKQADRKDHVTLAREVIAGGMDVEAQLTLCLSTAHIRSETDELLGSGLSFGLPVQDVHYGYLIAVGLLEPEEDCPPELLNLAQFAHLNGYDYLRLDPDAPVVDAFQIWSW